jgi:hypothetical protein
MRTPGYPKAIKSGSVVVKVYKVQHATMATGFAYVLGWTAAGGPKRQQFSREADALAEARVKAEQLAAGRVSAAGITSDDRETFKAARDLAGDVPLLAALAEWRRARELTDGHLIAAAEAWQGRNSSRFKAIKVGDAIDAFIKAKERAGRQGERTYRAKLTPLTASFPDQTLDTISSPALTTYLEQFQDGVTRNDLRKRAVALWRWAQKANHLPRGVALEIEQTDRADEKDTEIGILDAETYGRILEFISVKHPEHLAAVVLAGFCGIRADEIHGKRSDRSLRQTWEDIHLDKKFVLVTIAKKNTPAHRHAPLCDAAAGWLMLCPNRKGVVCEAGAMEKVRLLLRGAKFQIPQNCFRHSFISYRIAVTDGNKPQVATEAGNSVAEIDRRYRVPVTKGEGEAWFSVQPGDTGNLIGMDGKAVANS